MARSRALPPSMTNSTHGWNPGHGQPGQRPAGCRRPCSRWCPRPRRGDLGAVVGDAQRADQQVLAHPEAVQEHHQPTPILQPPCQQRGQPLGGRRHKPARDRRLASPTGLASRCSPTGSQPGGVAPRRQPRQHPGHDPLGQKVGGGERGVGLQRDLVSILAGAAHPGPAHPKPPPTQGDRALLAAVAHRHPGRIMLALGAGQLGDLHVHQLAHDLQADRGRGGQQALGHVRGEGGQVLVHPAGQPSRQPSGPGRHQPQRAGIISGAVGRHVGVGVLHAGSSSRAWRSSERPTSDAPGRTHLKSHGPRDNLAGSRSRDSPD
jgi:hypothetical protein